MPYIVHDFDTDFTIRLANVRESARAASTAFFDSHTRREVIETIVDSCAAEPVVLYPSTVSITEREHETGTDFDVPTTPSLRLSMACTGAVRALFDVEGPVDHADFGLKSTVSFDLVIDPTEVSASALTSARTNWIVKMEEAKTRANALIREHRVTLTKVVEAIAGVRYDRHAALVSAAAEALIPLTRTASDGIPIPLTPRRLTLDSVNKAAAVPGTEAALAENIADDLVGLIHAFSHSLERTPKTADKLLGADEETIRDVLLFILNANWKGMATGETFLGEGKADIVLRWQDRDAFIGECKIWKGASEFAEGITQLLGRYTVWRATRVALILFIRDRKDITGIIEKATRVITTHERFVEAIPETDPAAFRVRAQDDARQIVTLHLVPVVIPGSM